MKKNIIVILPIILSVITVAIFFNLSVKPMDTATNVLGQKELAEAVHVGYKQYQRYECSVIAGHFLRWKK